MMEQNVSRLYTAGVRGIEIIRTGLRNIATACEKYQLPSKYRAPVSAKYDISGQSSISHQSQDRMNMPVLGMGHGFGKTLIQNPSQEFLSQIKGIPIRCKAEGIARISTKDSPDCARIVNDIHVGINQFGKSLVNNALTNHAKCVFTKKNLPDSECGRQSTCSSDDKKCKSFLNDGNVRNSPSGECVTGNTESKTSSESSDSVHAKAATQENDTLLSKTDSSVYHVILTEAGQNKSDETKSGASPVSPERGANMAALLKTENGVLQKLPQEIKHERMQESESRNDVSEGNCTLNGHDSTSASPPAAEKTDEHQETQVVTYAEKLHSECKSTHENGPECTDSPGRNRKRPRPRRSNINPDKKMWMSRKSPEDKIEQENEDKPHFEQEEGHPQPEPPVDMLVKAFGYDPLEDAFQNMRSDVSLPFDLSDVQVPVFSRHQIKFKKNSEDECMIANHGASSALYLASKDGKDILVKDSSQSYRSAENAMREARILSLIDGTSVTPRLHGVLEQGLLQKEYCLVQDRCDGFIPLTQIMKSGYYISRSDWVRFSLSLASHLQILHGYRVLHNNICMDNILVNIYTMEVKLVGFGHASFRKGIKVSSELHDSHGLSAEVRYGCITSPQSDVYALGSVLEKVMLESRVMALHEVVLLAHQDLPRDRPTADVILSMIKDIQLRLR